MLFYLTRVKYTFPHAGLKTKQNSTSAPRFQLKPTEEMRTPTCMSAFFYHKGLTYTARVIYKGLLLCLLKVIRCCKSKLHTLHKQIKLSCVALALVHTNL